MSEESSTSLTKKLDCQIAGQPTPTFVGDKFDLVCTGFEQAELPEQSQFQFASEDSAYVLHLLTLNKEPSDVLRMQVTSYRAGEHQNLSFIWTDGTNAYSLGPLNLQVASVLKQGEEPKPVPSIGPLDAGMPWWFWATLAACLFIIVLRGGLHFYKRLRRQRLMEELQKMQTMLPPFGQFSKDMRSLLREIQNTKDKSKAPDIFTKLNEDFRLYLVRELQVPAHKMSRKEILDEMKESHRHLYGECRKDLEKILIELEKGSKDKLRIGIKDCEQILASARVVGEKIYLLKSANRSSKVRLS